MVCGHSHMPPGLVDKAIIELLVLMMLMMALMIEKARGRQGRWIFHLCVRVCIPDHVCP